MTLDAEDIEAVAARVVELLRDSTTGPRRYVDAATLARTLGVERDWVYARARELGACGSATARRRGSLRSRARPRRARGDRRARPAFPGRAPASPARAPAQAGYAGRVSTHPGEGWPVSEDLAMLRSVTHDGPAGATTPPGPAPEVQSDAGLSSAPRGGADGAAAHVARCAAGNRAGIAYSVQFSYRGEDTTSTSAALGGLDRASAP